MRIEIEDAFGITDLHGGEHVERALAGLGLADRLVGAQRLDDLPADGHDRVQRVFRILQDHGYALAAQRAPLGFRGLEEVDAVEVQPFGIDDTVFGGQAHDGAAGLRLAGTALADDAEPFAAEREGHAAHRLDDTRTRREGDAQVFYVEKRAHWPLPRGSSASRRPSPSRLKPRLTMRMATPGAAATHH